MHGELVVGHVLVHVALIAAEHRIAHAGVAHALEHHLGEQTLELLRDLTQRRRIVGLRAASQRRELPEVVRIDRRACVGQMVSVDAQCHAVTSDDDELGAQRAGFLESFEDRDQVAGRGAHLVDSAHDVVEIDARVEHEHA